MKKYPIPYSDNQLSAFDKLLNHLYLNNSNYTNIVNKILSESEFKDVCEINKKFQLFEYDGEIASFKPDATSAIKIGMKKYILNFEKEKDKPNRNARYAILISILALLITLLFNILNYCSNKHSNNQSNNINKYGLIKIDNSTSYQQLDINYKKFIKIIEDSLIRDTNFVKEFSGKVFHNH